MRQVNIAAGRGGQGGGGALQVLRHNHAYGLQYEVGTAVWSKWPHELTNLRNKYLRTMLRVGSLAFDEPQPVELGTCSVS